MYSGELNSGKEDVRAKRKELIRAAEQLIDRVEAQVAKFDTLTKKR